MVFAPSQALNYGFRLLERNGFRKPIAHRERRSSEFINLFFCQPNKARSLTPIQFLSTVLCCIVTLRPTKLLKLTRMVHHQVLVVLFGVVESETQVGTGHQSVRFCRHGDVLTPLDCALDLARAIESAAKGGTDRFGTGLVRGVRKAVPRYKKARNFGVQTSIFTVGFLLTNALSVPFYWGQLPPPTGFRDCLPTNSLTVTLEYHWTGYWTN